MALSTAMITKDVAETGLYEKSWNAEFHIWENSFCK